MAKGKRPKERRPGRTLVGDWMPLPAARLCFMSAPAQDLEPQAIGFFQFEPSVAIKLEYLTLPFEQGSIVRAVCDDSDAPALSFISDGGLMSAQLAGGKPTLQRISLDHRIIRPGHVLKVEIQNGSSERVTTRVGLVFWPVLEEPTP